MSHGPDAAARTGTSETGGESSSADRSDRAQRWFAGLMLSGLLVATAGAFAITEKLKLSPVPITGTRVSKVFSPVCRCSTNAASVRFRLRGRGRVEVDVVDRRDQVVRRLARHILGPGFVSFRWFGYGNGGQISPDGSYAVRVRLFSEHRTILLPNVIRLVTAAPAVEAFSISRDSFRVGDRLQVSYRLSEDAHPILLVDGRRAVYGRFAHRSGTLDWFGKITSTAAGTGRHTLTLEARDDAGNTSPSSGRLSVRVRPPTVRLRGTRHIRKGRRSP